MERIVEFEPAWDKRDPDPKKDYGISSVRIRFVLKGRKGAVQFLVSTDWYLPQNQKELGERASSVGMLSRVRPMGVDVGYHSPIQRYEDQKTMGPCPYLDGHECYYDGSSLRGDQWVEDVLLPKGSDGVWTALEGEYHATFDGDPDRPESWLSALEKSGLTPEQQEKVKARMATLVEAGEERYRKSWREEMDRFTKEIPELLKKVKDGEEEKS